MIFRSEEYALVDGTFLISVTGIAAAINAGVISEFVNGYAGPSYTRWQVSIAQFERACRRTLQKTTRQPSKSADAASRFLNEQLDETPVLAVDLGNNEVAIIDGRKRAEQWLPEVWHHSIDVLVVSNETAFGDIKDGIGAYVRELGKREQELMALMAGRSIRLDAAEDESTLGDIVSLALPETTKRKPPDEGEGAVFGWIAARAALALRDRKYKQSGRLKISSPYVHPDFYLSNIKAIINNNKYRAYYTAAITEADDFRIDRGTHMQLKGNEEKLKQRVQKYLSEQGLPALQELDVSLELLSTSEIRRCFVLFSRMLELYRIWRSAGLEIQRYVSEKGSKKTYEEWSNELVDNKVAQNRTWMRLSALTAVAWRCGINPASYSPDMNIFYDLLFWWSQLFFIKRGLWRPLKSTASAEQFLYWMEVCRLIERVHGGKYTYAARAWKNVFQEFEKEGHGLRLFGREVNGLEYATDACIRFIEGRTSLYEAQGSYSKGYRVIRY